MSKFLEAFWRMWSTYEESGKCYIIVDVECGPARVTPIFFSHDTTPEIWQETYLSAILRAIFYSDDPTYWLEAYRRLDPITSSEGEVRFLEAAEALFLQGGIIKRDTGFYCSTRFIEMGWRGQAGKSGQIQKSKLQV